MAPILARATRPPRRLPKAGSAGLATLCSSFSTLCNRCWHRAPERTRHAQSGRNARGRPRIVRLAPPVPAFPASGGRYRQCRGPGRHRHDREPGPGGHQPAGRPPATGTAGHPAPTDHKASHQDKLPSGAIVLNVRDAKSGDIEVFYGTSQVQLQDKELTARIVRAIG